MNNMMACPSCGLDKTESIVHLGSYILRCAACGEAIVATSSMGIFESDHAFSAFADPGPGKHPAPEMLIARGPLRQISTTTSGAARNGTLIRLIPEPKD
ncbi:MULTISPECIES: hypothetical protein [unclassified Rhizobium]|uniref:hypothetical protein n=1 Tax=unclassified Rhizobium TaxID=2613769 RepID=UPI001A98348B|nr:MULTISPECIES: hypothetical protein [unclassified Rhizobium]MBX5160938.1 hypothetical protein [Rhizobium sp. NZLR8]MBX5165924.1 hypothetical protein [Rhizobium sp. NZLR4b]MBX5174265.1 hypothetical protein [Rhizobium sp. NZLR1b]MBX5197065.1 hypothetical protein [Rhizobium sp. NZLR10]MBX5205292.1 hypothetical protein [Rhizobium sp. NZLR1]